MSSKDVVVVVKLEEVDTSVASLDILLISTAGAKDVKTYTDPEDIAKDYTAESAVYKKAKVMMGQGKAKPTPASLIIVMKGKCQLTVHPNSKAKMKSRLKELTSRSNGWGYAKRKQMLKEYIRGWVGYYHLANMKRLLLETDEWLRRRIRMCIWKSWKKVKTKVANLIRCGINKYKAYEWGNTRKGYWRIADSHILHRAITNEYLCRAGYATLMGAYLEWHPK